MRASWEIGAAYPNGWAVHVRCGQRHLGFLFPRGGGVWELDRHGEKGRQTAGTLDVRGPRDADTFGRWVRRYLAEAVRDMVAAVEAEPDAE